MAVNGSNLSVLVMLGNNSDVIEDALDSFLSSMEVQYGSWTILLLTVYGLLFVVSLLGNTMVLVVILGTKELQTVTNCFLLNLSVADLLVTTACMPLTVAELVSPSWIFGSFLCKMTGYIQGVTIWATVLTIVTISVDRFMIIRYPVKSRHFVAGFHTKKVIFLIWLVACLVALPIPIVRRVVEEAVPLRPGQTITFCLEEWQTLTRRAIFDSVCFVFIYVIPGTIVITLYALTSCHLVGSQQLLQNHQRRHQPLTPQHSQHQEVINSHQNDSIVQNRRRIAKMLILIAALFSVSWLPYHLVNLWMAHCSLSWQELQPWLEVLQYCLLLGHIHSAQNPLLYLTMHPRFKSALLALLKYKSFNHGTLKRQDSRYIRSSKYATSEHVL